MLRLGLATILLLVVPAVAGAQAPSQAELLEKLRQLEENQAKLEESQTKLYELLEEKDARLDALAEELERTKAAQEAATVPTAEPATDAVTAPVAAPTPAGPLVPESPAVDSQAVTGDAGAAPTTEAGKAETTAVGVALGTAEDRQTFGTYTPGRGFNFVKTKWGEVNFGAYTYLRYVNQKGLDEKFTNGLGNEVTLNRRDDLELNKVKLEFRGWMIDPHFRWVLYTWTNQAAQGQGAQVVVAGNLNWVFSDKLTIGGGILSLPTTRSTQGNFPSWLSVDHRTVADEFFRGSYASGFFAYGTQHGIGYYAMLASNLSILGVDAGQLDGDFSTVSAALWWMPTTGEFGPRQGFGDYEMHEDVATRIGGHFTFSPEDRQSQPDTDTIDNTQIRLSNGTIIFTPDALGTGTSVKKVKYYMADFDAGVKYKGFALEGEYYWRWLNDFSSSTPLPIDDVFDHGFQVLASAMVIDRTLQLYTPNSYIFGDFGDAWETGLGLNWFIFRRRELRFNAEYLYDHESPVGYTAVPQVVGGTGSIFNANLEMSF